MKKCIVIKTSTKDSKNVYDNKILSDIKIVNGKFSAKMTGINMDITLPFPQTLLTSEYLFNIVYDDLGFISADLMQLPNNSIKSFLWYYGFRNTHYVDNITNESHHIDSKLIYDSKSCRIYAYPDKTGYFYIDSIYVNFRDITNDELIVIGNTLELYKIKKYTIRYIFD
jgi:hypothetical protein